MQRCDESSADSAHFQKCDALRPSCSTCKIAGKQNECAYEENVERTFTEALIWRTHVLEQRLASYETQGTAEVGDANIFLDRRGSTFETRIFRVLMDSFVPAQSVAPTGLIASSSSQPFASILASLGSQSLPIFDFPQALNIIFDRPNVAPPTVDNHSISIPYVPSGLDELYVCFSSSSALFTH